MKKAKLRKGFTLVELLVVLGIIALLISLLMPALAQARQKANQVQCMSNMRQVGYGMLLYANDHDGFLFPDKMGWLTDGTNTHPPFADYTDPLPAVYQPYVWPYLVFGQYNPPIMFCPSDQDPVGEHSYILNDYMAYYNIKFSNTPPGSQSTADVILMGEKVSDKGDFYMELNEFSTLVQQFRHGLSWGSNYLMMDMHVQETLPPKDAQLANALDPWDPGGGSVTTTPDQGQ